jgi:hypothetical protein
MNSFLALQQQAPACKWTGQLQKSRCMQGSQARRSAQPERITQASIGCQELFGVTTGTPCGLKSCMKRNSSPTFSKEPGAALHDLPGTGGPDSAGTLQHATSAQLNAS